MLQSRPKYAQNFTIMTATEVDAYITQSPEFARPILTHLRKLIHQACPDVEESLKWSNPSFGHKGILCQVAAYKAHCNLYFWKYNQFAEPIKRSIPSEEKGGMGSIKGITSLKSLPSDKVLIACIKEAVRVNDAGVKRPAKKKDSEATKKELVIPDYLTTALATNKKAREAFAKFPYSHKKEYVEWLTEAKREETRQKRLATALEWLAEGKSRNWKYQNC